MAARLAIPIVMPESEGRQGFLEKLKNFRQYPESLFDDIPGQDRKLLVDAYLHHFNRNKDTLFETRPKMLCVPIRDFGTAGQFSLEEFYGPVELNSQQGRTSK